LGRINKTLIILAALALASACTTQKKRDDLSLVGKLWHNTTAHYNGYFNANELLVASIEQLEQQHQDNYNKTLEMYPYIAAENPQAVAQDLDKAMEKVSVVVNLHRVSNWTDDCYLLLGKAQFLKKDFESAEETLRYMVDEFAPAKMAKKDQQVKKSDKKVKKSSAKSKSKKRNVSEKERKKRIKEREKARKDYNRAVKKARKKGVKAPSREEFFGVTGTSAQETSQDEARQEEAPAEAPQDEIGMISISSGEEVAAPGDPDGYFLKHRPAYQEGVLWLAKTLIERDNYEGALRYMARLERDPKTFSDIRSQLAALQAYYFLKRKDYTQAIAHLNKAVETEKDRKYKARYAFIIAQLYQRAGQGEQAYAAFEKVLDHNPDFEMAFSAKLNLAQNAWYSGRGTAQEARDNLGKMLKEAKNAPYKDQIYFALAEIDLREGKREDAVKNLELSLKSSRQNRSQKAEAYLKLARLYYELEDYVPAKNYFDSTLQVLSSADDRFNEVERLSVNLTDIARHLTTIELQDSLLRIGRLSSEEKRALAYEIKKKRDEERRAQLIAQANSANDPSARLNRSSMPVAKAITPGATGAALAQNSDFFAYDDRKVKRGVRDFQRKWGSRPLQDNWRRSNNQSALDLLDVVASETATEKTLSDEEVNTILGNFPSTEDQINEAHFKIREAMYGLGSLYRERLNNYTKATEILEELNRRYPGSNYELDSWYFLYLSYSDLNNAAKSSEYRNKIIDKYPTSTYAKILQNPDYINELMSEERRLNNYYNEAYAAFQNGNFSEAYSKSNGAKEKFGASNALQPRFALLSAMCLGNLQGKDAYVEGLKEVLAKYPGAPEQTRAREILRLLGESGAALPGDVAEESSGQFQLEDDKLHYIIIVFKKDVSLDDSKVIVSDFNRKYHKLDNLKISNVYLGNTLEERLPIIVIRRYKDKAEAMRYYSGVKKNGADFLDQKKYPHEVFAVTQNNYREVLKNKTVDSYRIFFEANYLQ
jgi:tetratricopeptide (TPR) repeat protein